MIDAAKIEEWTAALSDASPAPWRAVLREPGYALASIERAPGAFRAADARLMVAARDALPALLSEREEMLAAIRVATDRLEEVAVALSGIDREHAAQVLRTTERARMTLAPFLR